jgi:hypothetical protein
MTLNFGVRLIFITSSTFITSCHGQYLRVSSVHGTCSSFSGKYGQCAQAAFGQPDHDNYF